MDLSQGRRLAVHGSGRHGHRTMFMISWKTPQIQLGSTNHVLLACRAYLKRLTPVDRPDGHLYVFNGLAAQTAGFRPVVRPAILCPPHFRVRVEGCKAHKRLVPGSQPTPGSEWGDSIGEQHSSHAARVE